MLVDTISSPKRILCREISRNERQGGSATKEWVERNFASHLHDDLFDTVYVSSNGWYERLRSEMAPLHAEVWLYAEEYRNEMGTVDPKLVTDAAIEADEEYPKKRLLVHYVQPHKPYIGPTAERYFEHAEGINMVEMMSRSEASLEDLKRAYYETLHAALLEVERLVDHLSGKTVISADHGELLGERCLRMPLKNFGHPTGIRISELREIPWLVCPHEGRNPVVSERPMENTSGQYGRELEKHLKSMGYL
jgi:hypothetical protein